MLEGKSEMNTVLLVDDEVAVILQLEERLTKMGYDVAGSAHSGTEAVRMAREKNPDVVLMDIVMPGKQDGIDAAEIIRSELDIPVLFLTGYAEETFVKRAKITEPFGYIVKPYHENEIAAAIEVAIHKKAMERKLRRTEEALRAQCDFAESVVQTAQVIVLVLDLKGRIVSFNPYMEHISGYRLEEVKGKDWFSVFLPEEIRSRIRTLFATAATDIQTRGNINPILTKDGKARDIEWHDKTLKDRAGNPVALVCIGQDITERKQAEEKFRNQSEIIVHMSEAVYLVGFDDHKIKYANPSFEKMFGYDPGEMVGKHVSVVNAPTDKTPREIEKEITEDLRRTGEWHGEVKNIKKDGTPFWCYANVGAFDHYEYGKVFVAVHTDITERKHIEEELQKMQKLESLGRLAGGIAHDFNNVLGAISGFCHLAQLNMADKEKVLEHLNGIQKTVSRATHLARELLTFSRGGIPVKKLINVKELIKESTEFALSGSRVTAKYRFDKNLLSVNADKEQIGQAIQNLVMNADHAMPDGGTISIYAGNVGLQKGNRSALKQGKYVKIKIEDKGIGIPEEHLKNIFDPFFTTKPTHQGLGLSTAYSIIRNHNGNIKVDSKPGVGTTFEIYFPASQKKALTERKKKKGFIAGEGKILVMDDSDDIRATITDFLTHMGYDVVQAKNGDEAIKLYKAAMESSSPVDVALLDLIVHGGMGGKETIKRLLETDPDVKAIVISGYSNDDVLANHANYGFSGSVSKPFDLFKLSKTISRLIGVRKNRS